MDISVKFLPIQQKVLKAIRDHPYVFFYGSRGSAKSFLLRYYILLRAIKYPANHLLVRRSLGELRLNHINPLIEILGQDAWNEQKKYFKLPNGAIIQLYYLRDNSSITSFQGQEYLTVGLDEAVNIPTELIQKLYATLRTTLPDAEPKCLMVGNPGGESHSYFKRLIDGAFADGERPEDWAIIKATVKDNPYLDKGYIAKLNALPPTLKSAWLYGNFESYTGNFFTVSPKSRVDNIQLLNKDWEVYLGLDHGTTHATVALLGLYNKTDNTAYLIETYLNNGLTAKEHAVQALNMCLLNTITKGRLPRKIWYDPAIATKQRLSEEIQVSVLDEYIEVWRKYNVEFIKADNDRKRGAQVMQDLFQESSNTGDPRFYYIADKNAMCLEYLNQIKPDPNNISKYKKVDNDADDFTDALRYLLTGIYSEMSLNSLSVGSGVYHSVPANTDWYNQ